MRLRIIVCPLLALISISYAPFIGDIYVNEKEDSSTVVSSPGVAGGVRRSDPDLLWPGGKVYYRFDDTFWREKDQNSVRNMMNYIETQFKRPSSELPCIVFENIDKSNKTRNDFVRITADGGGIGSGPDCFSQVGRISGEQILNLGASCLTPKLVLHELLHTLGFSHEMNRQDRNEFLVVDFDNIKENKKHNYKKRINTKTEHFDAEYDDNDVDDALTPFDITSVLMYQPEQTVVHTKNGKPAMKYHTQPSMSWPEPDTEDLLTAIDKIEVAAAYECEIDQSSLVDYINLNRLSTISRLENVTRENVNYDGGQNYQCQVLSKEVHEIRENNTIMVMDIDEAKATIGKHAIRISQQEEQNKNVAIMEKELNEAKATNGRHEIKISQQEEQNKNVAIMEKELNEAKATNARQDLRISLQEEQSKNVAIMEKELNEAEATNGRQDLRISHQEEQNKNVAIMEKELNEAKATNGRHENTISQQEEQNKNLAIMEKELNEEKATNGRQDLRISLQEEQNKNVAIMEKELNEAKATIGRQDLRISQQEEQNKNVAIMEKELNGAKATNGKHEIKIKQQEAHINNLTKQLSDTNGNLDRMEILLKNLISRVDNHCSDDPCGPHSECKNAGHIASCSCLSGYDGSPPTCTPYLLYLGNSLTVELPSFSPSTSCSVQEYPLAGLSYAVSAIVGGEVMVCGGNSGGDVSSCYSLKEEVWTSQPSMKKKRHAAAASLTDRGMFITGGYGGSHHSSTEYLTSGTWEYGPALPVPIYCHCQVSLGPGEVIVAGGYNAGNLASVYKLEYGEWKQLPDMNHARRGHSCGLLDGQLFVIGGVGAEKSVEVMDVSSGTWRDGPSLDVDHSWGQAVVHDSVLYVLYRDGKVVKLTDGKKWKDVASIESIGTRPVNPPPLVTAGMLGC